MTVEWHDEKRMACARDLAKRVRLLASEDDAALAIDAWLRIYQRNGEADGLQVATKQMGLIAIILAAWLWSTW